MFFAFRQLGARLPAYCLLGSSQLAFPWSSAWPVKCDMKVENSRNTIWADGLNAAAKPALAPHL